MMLGLRSDPVEFFEIGLVSVDPMLSVWFISFLKQAAYELGVLICWFRKWVLIRNSEFWLFSVELEVFHFSNQVSFVSTIDI